MGVNLKLSDAELRQHIVAAARHVRDGARPREAGNAAASVGEAFASRPERELSKPIPIVNVVGGVFGNVDRDLKGVRSRAIAYLRRLRDAGRLLSNDETGWKISLSNSGIREMVNFDSGKINMLLALPRITKVAAFGRSEPPRDGQHGVVAYHSLYAPVLIGNELRIARLVVREDVNGTFAYDFQRSDVLQRQSPADAGLVDGATSASTPAPKAGAKQGQPASMTVAQIRDMVNATGRDGWAMSRTPGAFYSALAEAVATAQGAPKKGMAEQW